MNRGEFDSLFKTVSPPTGPGVVQVADELWAMYSAARDVDPKVILEIGTENGGTARFWETLLTSDGLLITVDENRHQFETPGFCDFSEARASVVFLQEVNSQSPTTVQEVVDLLDGRTVDFLYIDADHSYEGVKKDFQNYSPLVRSGGVIGFHDSNHPPVRKLLDEINYPNTKFYDYGLGTAMIEMWKGS